MNIKKYFNSAVAVLAIGIMASCSSIDLPEAVQMPVPNSEAFVVNSADNSRKVVLNWENPAGATGVAVYQDGTTELYRSNDELINTLNVYNVAPNKDVTFTIKAIYENGEYMSTGVTKTVHINYNWQPTEGRKAALIVATDYEVSLDEQEAVKFFKKDYVDKNLGTIFTEENIQELCIEEYDRVWVMCDRVGLEKGPEKLPASLLSNNVLNTLNTFIADGGNVLLTNHATQLSVTLGRIDGAYAPGIYGDGPGGFNPDQWGSQAKIGNGHIGGHEGESYDHASHPIYAGMRTNDTAFWNPIFVFTGAGIKGDHNCMWDLNAYGLTGIPNTVVDWEQLTNSTVLGTWNHVEDYCCAGIIDFAPTTDFHGRVLAVGLAAYEWSLSNDAEHYDNEFQDNMELFTNNALNYLKYKK